MERIASHGPAGGLRHGQRHRSQQFGDDVGRVARLRHVADSVVETETPVASAAPAAFLDGH